MTTPAEFHELCTNGDLPAIEQALQTDARLIDAEHEGFLPIQRTIPCKPEALKRLLDNESANREVDRIHWFEWEERANAAGLTSWRLMHMAAIHGYDGRSLDTLEVLLKAGADFTVPTPLYGYSALHLAVMSNMFASARFLAEQCNLDVNNQSQDNGFDWKVVPTCHRSSYCERIRSRH